MKRIILLCCINIFLLHTVSLSQEKLTDSIFYQFPDGTDKLIENGIEKYSENKMTGSSKYCLVLQKANQDTTILLLSNFSGGFIQSLVNSSNRFFKMKSGKILPIIFTLDLIYASKPVYNGQRVVSVNMGGYEIIILRDKAIEGKGFVM